MSEENILEEVVVEEAAPEPKDKYIMVGAAPELFGRAVSKFLREGYILHGNPIYLSDGNKFRSFYQAVVLPPENQDE